MDMDIVVETTESQSRPDDHDHDHPDEPVDPIWTSSRTARQIYALGEVEKDIGKLLALAASSISLLALPQTDPPESNLPHGEERSEQFVMEANEYFERLDQIHISMRSTLAHIRQSRIAPSAINAPPPNFIPQSAGVGTPNLNLDTHANTSNTSNTNTDSSSSGDASGDKAPVNGVVDELGKRGLQEERVHRDAWRGILDALTRLKEARTKSEFSE